MSFRRLKQSYLSFCPGRGYCVSGGCRRRRPRSFREHDTPRAPHAGEEGRRCAVVEEKEGLT
jgi:hypothetical protein